MIYVMNCALMIPLLHSFQVVIQVHREVVLSSFLYHTVKQKGREEMEKALFQSDYQQVGKMLSREDWVCFLCLIVFLIVIVNFDVISVLVASIF